MRKFRVVLYTVDIFIIKVKITRLKREIQNTIYCNVIIILCSIKNYMLYTSTFITSKVLQCNILKL